MCPTCGAVPRCVVQVKWAYGSGEVGICDVLFKSSRSGMVFSPRAKAITERSQSLKDVDPYFKSKLYIQDPGHQKPVVILLNGLSKLKERAHDLSIDRRPVSYH